MQFISPPYTAEQIEAINADILANGYTILKDVIVSDQVYTRVYFQGNCTLTNCTLVDCVLEEDHTDPWTQTTGLIGCKCFNLQIQYDIIAAECRFEDCQYLDAGKFNKCNFQCCSILRLTEWVECRFCECKFILPDEMPGYLECCVDQL